MRNSIREGLDRTLTSHSSRTVLAEVDSSRTASHSLKEGEELLGERLVRSCSQEDLSGFVLGNRSQHGPAALRQLLQLQVDLRKNVRGLELVDHLHELGVSLRQRQSLTRSNSNLDTRSSRSDRSSRSLSSTALVQ